MQDRKLAFVNAAAGRHTVSPDRLTEPPSRYVLQAGAVIPAALITGIRWDLPGHITAQVTQNVYDTRDWTKRQPAKPIAPMLARFIASDRGFAKTRKSTTRSAAPEFPATAHSHRT